MKTSLFTILPLRGLSCVWTSIIVSIMILHAETRTITADVNGDNMYDAIKITDNAVYVVDKMLCCTKKRFPIISSCDSMYDVLVNDFAPSFRSNEVAIVFGKETATSTIVYAFNNGAFVKISDNLPGMITFCGNAPCIDSNYNIDGDIIPLPWPILENQGYLKPAALSSTIDSHVTIEPGDVFSDTLVTPPGTYMLIAVWKQASNVSVSLRDDEGKTVTGERPKDPVLVSILDPTMYDHILHIDNRRSPEPATVRCIKLIFTLPQ
jgi:hypothetical protein